MSSSIEIKYNSEDEAEKIKKIEVPKNINDKKEIDENDSASKGNVCNRLMTKTPNFLYYFRLVVLNIIAVTYFTYATYVWITRHYNQGFDWCSGYGFLLLIYFFIYGRIVYNYVLKNLFFIPLKKVLSACLHSFGYKRNSQKGEISICIILTIAIGAFLVIDTNDSRDRLIGLIGIILMIALGWGLSKNPTKVDWKPMVWGLLIQFILAIISIRVPIGRSIFECLSDKIVVFLDFSKDGAKFVFSEELVENGVFAFTVLPVIIFFSFIVKVLYYFGVMQYMIRKIGWLLCVVLGTTACESLHAATTLFLGLPESFLVIEPYMNQLTESEMHAVMCSCFSTISGTVIAAYISYGVQPIHLLTAMVMSAPAGLCFAKLIYPETQKSSTHFKNIVLKKSEETSFLDAATSGALSAIPLILGVIANVVAFVSAVAFVNAILAWLGVLVGYEGLTFDLILAKIFTPMSYVIGVPREECETVGTLIGLKTVVNELIAYEKLGQFKLEGKLSPKAEAIATYAICGFSNPGALGTMIGSLSTMAPEKKGTISAAVMRAFVGGIAVCFLKASIAGLLITNELT